MINQDDIKSAFDKNGVFTSDNWNDEYINKLRFYIDENDLEVYNNDEYCAIIPHTYKQQPIFIVLQWYKHRGRTQQGYVIRANSLENTIYPLTFKVVCDFIEKNSKFFLTFGI